MAEIYLHRLVEHYAKKHNLDLRLNDENEDGSRYTLTIHEKPDYVGQILKSGDVVEVGDAVVDLRIGKTQIVQADEGYAIQ